MRRDTHEQPDRKPLPEAFGVVVTWKATERSPRKPGKRRRCIAIFYGDDRSSADRCIIIPLGRWHADA